MILARQRYCIICTEYEDLFFIGKPSISAKVSQYIDLQGAISSLSCVTVKYF